MHFAIPNGHPPGKEDQIKVRRGGKRIMFLFAATILTTVYFHKFLHLPPFLGMMTGLAYLQFFGYYLRKSHGSTSEGTEIIGDISLVSMQGKHSTSFGVWRVPSGTPCCFSMASRFAWVAWASSTFSERYPMGYAAGILIHLWINAATFQLPSAG
jgi:hypothetical protein